MVDLSFDVADHAAKDRSLPAQNAFQALVLLGVGIAPSSTSQLRAFPFIALTEDDPFLLGKLHELLASDFQKATVGWM